MALPLFVRRFVFDAAQGALVAVIALNIAIPGTLNEGSAVALVTLAAVVRGVVAAVATAATKAMPGFLAWLAGKLALDAPEA